MKKSEFNMIMIDAFNDLFLIISFCIGTFSFIMLSSLNELMNMNICVRCS